MTINVAFLRGINVGGKNVIKMADLAAWFEGQGFSNARTYIQSGNVIFGSEETDKAVLTRALEAGLSEAFNYASVVVVRSLDEMKEIVAQAPPSYGSERETYFCDVVYLKHPLDPSEALESLSTREGVDQAFTGPGVLYFMRLISRASQSHLTRLTGLPIYQFVTIRNWNTTTKLLSMMESAAPEG